MGRPLTDWGALRHAYGEASDLDALLSDVADGDTRACLDALDAIMQRIAHQGTLYTATGPAIAGIIGSLNTERADAAIAICMRLTGLLRRLRPSILSARAQSDPGPLGECDTAFAEGVPILQELRRSPDVLVRVWAIELLSFMPDTVAGLATEELARLQDDEEPISYMTSAIVAANDGALAEQWMTIVEGWLHEGSARSRAAAMCWALCRGNPGDRNAVPDAAFAVLLELARGERWDDWEALPAREHGFFADLATHLLASGYHRAEATLPALFDLLPRCADAEVPHVAQTLVRLVYHSAPYPGAPQLSALTPLQRHSLARLARVSRVWEAPAELAISLSQLDLPLDPIGLLEFLGESTEGVAPASIKVTGVDGDIVTLETDLAPHETLRRLGGRRPSDDD